MKSLFSTFLILITLALFFFFIDGMYGSVKILWEEREKALNVEEKFDYLQNVRSEVENTMTRAQSNHELLNTFLPNERDDARTMMSLSSIAGQSGVSLDSARITEGFDRNTGNQQADQSLGVQNIQITFSSSYSNFLQFLRNIENSLRFFEITSISVKGGEESAQFSVGLQLYWFK